MQVLNYFISAAVEDEAMVYWLLEHGADPNRQCAIDLTPLSNAVRTGSLSVIHLMFRYGGDAKKGQLLHHAVERQNNVIDVVKVLLEKGATINATMYQDHYFSWRLYYFMGLGTALHQAAKLGKADIVRFLIDEGADLRIKDANDHTALQVAQIANAQEVVDVLSKEVSLSSSQDDEKPSSIPSAP